MLCPPWNDWKLLAPAAPAVFPGEPRFTVLLLPEKVCQLPDRPSVMREDCAAAPKRLLS